MNDKFLTVTNEPPKKEEKLTRLNAIIVIFSLIGFVALFIMVVVADKGKLDPVNQDPLDILNNSETSIDNTVGVQSPPANQQQIPQNINLEEHGIGEGLTEGGIKEVLSNTPVPTPTPTAKPTATPIPTSTSTPQTTVTATITPSSPTQTPTETPTPTPSI